MFVARAVTRFEQAQVRDVGNAVVDDRRGDTCPWLAEMSITRLIWPDGVTRSSSPWLESIGYSAPPMEIMLRQFPFGSKSSGSGLATGCAFWKALRFAISFQVPPAPTLMTPLGTVGTPWEQPAPASSA